MILFELTNTEQHQVYQDLSIDNLQRQYHFLRSVINAALALKRPMLSSTLIKALNAHAISCLHVKAGEYRPCAVRVGAGAGNSYDPPDHYRVPDLMNEFINEVNYSWEQADPILLATYVLWKVNYIHPFINGNGRTARALCYYVVCVKAGGLLKGEVILPELIRQNRAEYVAHLKYADAHVGQQDHLLPLYEFIKRLVQQQLDSAQDDEETSEDAVQDVGPVPDGDANQAS